MGTLGDSTELRPLKIDFIIFVPRFRLHWELVDCELKFIASMCCYVDRPMDSESLDIGTEASDKSGVPTRDCISWGNCQACPLLLPAVFCFASLNQRINDLGHLLLDWTGLRSRNTELQSPQATYQTRLCLRAIKMLTPIPFKKKKKKARQEARELAQPVQCLLRKHEDLNFNPQIPLDKSQV